MNITQNLQKWGNSTGLRIPKKVLDAANIRDDQLLSIDLKDGSIVLTPVKDPKTFTLSDMLRGVTPADVVGEVSWGGDVGSEVIDD